jgi:hypothetical protein
MAVGDFNYDLEKMKKAVDSPSTTMPHGLKGKELVDFLLHQSRALNAIQATSNTEKQTHQLKDDESFLKINNG